MPTGHIKLGKYADVTLRDYILTDPKQYQSATANPFAARVSTGGPYHEQDQFNDWTAKNWSTGVGNIDPDSGQLFSIADTRYPGYVWNPWAWEYPLDGLTATGGNNYQNGDLLPVSGTEYATSFTGYTGATSGVWVNIYVPEGYTITAKLYTQTGSLPGTAQRTTTVTSTMKRPHAHWVWFSWTSYTLIAGSTYYIGVTTNFPTLGTEPIVNLPATTPPSGEDGCVKVGAAAWDLNYNMGGTTAFQFLLAATSIGEIKGVYATSVGTFVWHDNTVSKVGSGVLTSKVTKTTIYDVKLIGPYLYVSYGSGGYVRYNTLTDSSTDYAGTSSYMLLAHKGYLWRSVGSSVAYSNDEVTWEFVVPAVSAETANDITGMAGMGDYVYASTHMGLYMVALGDAWLQLLVWPEVSTLNGVGMVSWEDALYIPMVDGSILRFDQNGGLLNVGMNARYPLPVDVQGRVVALYPTNYFLFASVQPRSATGYPTLWAYNVDGWHCLALGPQLTYGKAMCLDRYNDKFLWGTTRGLLHRTNYPSNVTNPAYNTNELILARDGWIEYDKFYAGNHTLEKDCDRILIDAEQGSGYVYTYWKNAQNTNWVHVGAGDMRFAASTRPTGKWVRFGYRMSNKGGTTLPIVRAISIKYSTNVTDRWRWVLSIPVHDKQQFPDGTINPYTAAQQLAHLEDLIDEVSPLQLRDVNGTTYVVTCTGASKNIVEWSYKPPGAGKTVIKWVYTLTLEEVQS